MIPPTVTQSLSRRSATAEIGQSTLARITSRSGLSGCAETNSPIASFSAASSCGCSNSSTGIGGGTGRPSPSAATFCPAVAVPVAGAAAGGSLFLEIEDRALTDLGVLLDLLAVGLRFLEDLQHPLAAGTGRAERATLDQRLDRLLVDRAVVHALAEVPDRGEW